MNDIVYIDHMKIAILDKKMSKVPIISGYDTITTTTAPVYLYNPTKIPYVSFLFFLYIMC